eukprot:TRINITY_DN2839_c0_g2_i2.p1 TRINITY_DN2839_c0_g2~~TRINITY_DN2839_c0_g2_i2.p1  ORF type:complete len:185 (+),score=75.99 TRINITY_DN2839_c0_g2_i2:153-707(+)
MARCPGIDFEVRWRPFMLDPSLPAEGVDKISRYNAKFGPERVQKMLPYMKSVGEQDGIAFSYGGLVGNTFDSHRLIEWSWSKGGASCQDKVVEALFSRYFELEKNMGDHAVLVDAASAAGLDAEETRTFLQSGDLSSEVTADMERFRREHRVSGVPFFIIGGRDRLSGAQDADVFVHMFRKFES